MQIRLSGRLVLFCMQSYEFLLDYAIPIKCFNGTVKYDDTLEAIGNSVDNVGFCRDNTMMAVRI